MKKSVALFVMMIAIVLSAIGGGHIAIADSTPDYSSYTIRLYSNGNAQYTIDWLTEMAGAQGFKISMDDNSVLAGDMQVIQAANEKKDGDLIWSLNETRWEQLVNGQYENLSILDWTPSWADEVGRYAFPGKAYGIGVSTILLLARTDEYGTNGESLHFAHWGDMVDSGYSWYRQNRIGGSTNLALNAAILYPYADPTSPAGGISVDGWKKLWDYCAGGVYSADQLYTYGFDPVNMGEVAIGSFFSASFYMMLDIAAQRSDIPLTDGNWELVEIDDGTFGSAGYIGILDREDRTEEQTEIVKAFAEWFGSPETMAAYAEEFGGCPCSETARQIVYGDEVPDIFTMDNMALNMVEGTDMNYVSYQAKHVNEWTNIITNLGFFWTDPNDAPAEPDWDNLDWATLTQAK